MTDVTIEERLDDWLESALRDLGEEPRDLDHAARLLGALRGVQRRRSQVEQLVARRISELTTFRDREVAPLIERAEHLEALIASWALAQNEETGRKTWKVPEGVIGVRPRRPRLDVDHTLDRDMVVGLVRGLRHDYVRVEEDVDRAAVKADAEPGALIPDYRPDLIPDGYEPREALVPSLRDPAGPLVVVPGVVLFVPKLGRAGKTAKVTAS